MDQDRRIKAIHRLLKARDETRKESEGFSPDLSREMRSLFADSFFGPDEIESAFTVKDAQGKDVKLIELTPAERQEASRLLKEKLNEPDIKAFLLEMKKTPDELKNDWALTLRLTKFKDGTDITMKALRENPLILAKMKEIDPKQKGVIWTSDENWLKQQPCYTTHTPAFDPATNTFSMRWSLRTKELIPGPNDVDHAALTKELEKFSLGKRLGNAGSATGRKSAPAEDVFYLLERFLKTKEKGLVGKWAWSDVEGPVGYFVHVGRFGTDGVRVDRDHSVFHIGSLGVALSR
ncbi:hypothetical protein HYV73_02925 [Candidatus Uhrbacteria bacterium]|nr:hypothetical protein [Candidatus Uhrbacteria bacterium]